MIRDDTQLIEKIEECEERSAETFFIYKATWNLIISPLKWARGKTRDEIMTRRGQSKYAQGQEKNRQKRDNWQLIIETLSWVLLESEIDPIDSRKMLIFWAG
jgi:hypothetical protein